MLAPPKTSRCPADPMEVILIGGRGVEAEDGELEGWSRQIENDLKKIKEKASSVSLG